MPFRGQLQDAKPSFMEMLMIAEEIIDEIGMPMSSESRGRRRKYDWGKVLAALLCCKVDGRTPCDSELHYVYSKIPEEWLDKALERLDDKVTALYVLPKELCFL